jgi:subtilisin family serine protease
MSRDARTVRNQENGQAFWGNLFRGATLALATALALALSFSPVLAAKGGKAGVASDLQEKVQKESPSNSVRVLVNLNGGDPLTVAGKIKELGGEVRGHFRNVDVMVVDLPLGAVDSLAEVEGLDYLAPDRPVTGLASQLETTTGAALAYGGTPSVWNFSGIDGSGVGVAVLDSGIDPSHVDLRDETKGTRRVVFSWDFTGRGGLDDPYGHGTHIAGIIAGDGSASYAAGRDYTGMAPGANLINFKVLDERGHGYISSVVAAIDQAISLRNVYNIKVINLSLAAPPIDSYVNDPMCRAVERAARAGIVVVAAAGNFGQDQDGNKVYGGITSPGISPSAITVGATLTRGTDIRSDDIVAPYSSRGPTLSHTTDPVSGQVVYDDLAKPDLVAPGTRLVSLERSSNYLVTTYPVLHVDTGNNVNNKSRYMLLTGTSMATGVVSGAVALMTQANPGLTPNQVKAILMYSAQIMDGADLFEQGAGMLNVDGAVRLAKSMSRYAYALPAGATLIRTGLPTPQSVIAGETCLWSQSLIWGGGMLRGDAALTNQQLAYAQSLIWGIGRFDSWGLGVTYYDGLFSDSYVVFGKDNQWNYVTWNAGTPTSSGLIWNERLYGSGLIWGNQIISNDFFNVGPTSLIWGIAGYGGYDMGLIWTLRDCGLIWGNADAW